MKAVIKISVAIVSLLLLLLVGAIIAVAVLVDPNDYRDEIADAVEQRTGRQLVIEGDLSLKLLPCCGIGIGRSSLSNPPGFGSEAFARVEEVRLGLRLWPLLTRRELLIGQITLTGGDISLLRLADGRVNWEFADPDEKPASAAADEELSAGDDLALSIDGIEITDTRVAFVDQAAGSDYLLENIDLQTGPIEPGRPFKLNASLSATDRAAGIRANLSLDSIAAVDTRAMSGELRQLKADLDVAGNSLPGGSAELKLELAAVTASDEGGQLDGLVAQLRAAGAEIRIEGGGQFQPDGSGLAGSFALKPMSLRKVLPAMEIELPETSDPAALNELQAGGQWRLGKDRADLDALELRLDDTRVSGAMGISNFSSPRYRFELNGDRLDLDRYLPPDSDDEKAAGNTGPAAQSETSGDALRDLVVDGKLGLAELIVSGARLQELSATVKARDGVITLAPMSARLYGGGYAGSLRLDVSGDKPRIDLDQTLDAVQLGGLLTDLAEVEQLEGLVQAKLKLSGSGLSEQELKQSLAGNLSFQLADGLYKGMDIWYEIRKARARIKGDPPPERSGPAQTTITALQLDGVLGDGVLRSNRLVGEIPFLRLTGSGALDILQEGLDYDLEARVFKKPEFPNGETLDDLTNLVIPLTIGGTIESPKIGVNLAGLAKSAAGQKLKEKLIKELDLDEKEPAPTEDGAAPKEEKPEDILKRGLRDLLKGQ